MDDDKVVGKLSIMQNEPSKWSDFDNNNNNKCQVEKTIDIIFNTNTNKLPNNNNNSTNTTRSTSPMSIHYCNRYGLVFLLTKSSLLYIYEVESGQLIFVHNLEIMVNVENDKHQQTNNNNNRSFNQSLYNKWKILHTVQNSSIELNKTSSGFVAVYENGLVVSIEVDEQCLMYYLVNYLNAPKLAYKIAARCSLTSVDQLILDKFEFYFQAKNYVQAAQCVAVAASPQLRTSKIVERFRLEQNNTNSQNTLVKYSNIALIKK